VIRREKLKATSYDRTDSFLILCFLLLKISKLSFADLVAAGLVAYFTFSSDAPTLDMAFSIGNLQASGSPTYLPDGPWPGSQCAALTSAGDSYGGGQYFRLNPLNLGAMSASTGFSICTWFVFDATTIEASVFDFGTGAGSSGVRLFRWRSSTQLQLQYSYCGYTFPKPIINGQWRHVCVVNQGSSWSVYDDGLLDASWFTPCSLNNAQLTSNFIGRSNSYSAPLLIMRVDEFRIYQKQLALSNISSVYNGLSAFPGTFFFCHFCTSTYCNEKEF
jgi:hypothetical protein